MILLLILILEMGVIEGGVSLFDPSGTDQIGIDFGTRGAQRFGGSSSASIGLDDVSKVFVTQSVVTESMLHGGKNLGFTVEIEQFDDLFDLMGQMQFGLGQEFQIVVGRLPQSQQCITVFEISAMRS
jgi:hypothetical protein